MSTGWLDITPELRALAERDRGRAVEEGDVWRACPREAVGTLRWRDSRPAPTARGYSGVLHSQLVLIRDGQCTAIRTDPEPAAVEWVKLFLKPDALEINLRPGLVLGSTIPSGRAIVVPGFRRSLGEPAFTVEYTDPNMGTKWGRYRLAHACSMSATPGEDLVAFLGMINSAIPLAPSGWTDALACARRLLAEALGLATPSCVATDDLPSIQRQALFPRGEFVRVRFAADHSEVPCLVVSDDAVNGSDHDSLLVLQTLPYRSSHDATPAIVPLPCSLLQPRRSIDLTLLRGMAKQNARRLVSRYSPPLVLPDELLQHVHSELVEFFGP